MLMWKIVEALKVSIIYIYIDKAPAHEHVPYLWTNVYISLDFQVYIWCIFKYTIGILYVCIFIQTKSTRMKNKHGRIKS